MAISKEEYRRRVEAGVCAYCAGERDREDRRHCEKCRERFKKYDRARDADPERRNRKVEGNRILRAADPKKYRDISKASLDKLRSLVYSAYGNVCACCGETSPLFLTLDHVNNDGAQHRRSLTGKNYGARIDAILRWARDNNFPNTLRLLCFNCNCGRHRNKGVCPHQLSMETTQEC